MKFTVERLPNNPIIHPNMKGLRGQKGKNINGPTLIKVPKWIKNPLGKYFLYFGHHGGQYIRLAYSDTIKGPYTTHKPGTLNIKNTNLKKGHIASPEILIRDDLEEIWMYYHASVHGTGVYSDQIQMTFLAKSKDGIHFTSDNIPLAPFYLRVFQYDGYIYGLAKNENKNGVFVRSVDGTTEFERGPTFVKGFRHNALYLKGNCLWVFFSKKGDKPERIKFSRVDLREDWKKWKLEKPITVLEPEEDWEGAKLKLEKSKYGSTKPTRALRDPCIFEEDNQIYLLYSVKGEQGIAIAKLIIED